MLMPHDLALPRPRRLPDPDDLRRRLRMEMTFLLSVIAALWGVAATLIALWLPA